MASYNVELARTGPGLLLRDIQREAPDVMYSLEVIAHIAPDIIALQSIDWDAENRVIAALTAQLRQLGHDYAHFYSARPNRGVPSGYDLDGNERFSEAADAWGFGQFPGQSGMAILSRWPISLIRDDTNFVWQHFEGNLALPEFPPMRLSTTGHWHLRIATPSGDVDLLTWHATPPVFDDKRDQNGRRNADEILFWIPIIQRLDHPFVLLGDANIDPFDGEGRHDAIARVLSHPKLIDPRPASVGAIQASRTPPNHKHLGSPQHDTVDWSAKNGPGNLRVSYVLPSRHWTIVDSGVHWPIADPKKRHKQKTKEKATRHKLVWVDLSKSQ